MKIFYKISEKEMLDIRNNIVLESAIPILIKNGFSKTPFSTSWYGRNNLNDFTYELCRLSSSSRLELIEIQISRGDKWLKFFLNIFELVPYLKSLDQLQGSDGLKFHIPPDSITKMHLRSDDIIGPPLFRLRYLYGHKLKSFKTQHGLLRKIDKLKRTIEKDSSNINHFVKLWHELHQPTKTSWAGHPINNEKY
jgi:hypothetical protein